MRVRLALKGSVLALLIGAGLVLGTAGPADAGVEHLYGVNFASASGLNVPVPAGRLGSYGGASYTTMLSTARSTRTCTSAGPTRFKLSAKTFSYGWCAHPAHAIVTVDGSAVIDTYPGTDTTSLAISNAGRSIEFQPGWHRIAVIFDNDSWVAGQCDVNLDVAGLERDAEGSPFYAYDPH